LATVLALMSQLFTLDKNNFCIDAYYPTCCRCYYYC
jgi:hypothetical protein